MKKILNLAFLLLACFVISSCSDDGVATQAPVIRDYQTDARILSRFVDINKTMGEYYINENKKNSPLAYISDKDWQELQEVNPVNKTKFENDLRTLNAQLETAAKRPDVSQIVYSTYGETWVRTISEDAPFTVEKNNTANTRSARSTYAHMELIYDPNGFPQYASFTTGRQVRSEIDVNLFGYKYYFIEIVCKIDASKNPTNVGGNNPKSIVLSGSTSMEHYSFTWTANSSDTSIYWQFEGKQHAPSEFGGSLIKVDFMD